MTSLPGYPRLVLAVTATPHSMPVCSARTAPNAIQRTIGSPLITDLTQGSPMKAAQASTMVELPAVPVIPRICARQPALPVIRTTIRAMAGTTDRQIGPALKRNQPASLHDAGWLIPDLKSSRGRCLVAGVFHVHDRRHECSCTGDQHTEHPSSPEPDAKSESIREGARDQ